MNSSMFKSRFYGNDVKENSTVKSSYETIEKAKKIVDEINKNSVTKARLSKSAFELAPEWVILLHCHIECNNKIFSQLAEITYDKNSSNIINLTGVPIILNNEIPDDVIKFVEIGRKDNSWKLFLNQQMKL